MNQYILGIVGTLVLVGCKTTYMDASLMSTQVNTKT